MHKSILLFTLLLIPALCYSQQRISITYNQLKEYEGLYEYENNTTLKIAASPKDTLLYAVINESTYALRPVGKDLFLNMSNEKVTFYRDKSNAIAGYITARDTFGLINRKVFFPKEMWYARLSSSKEYKYSAPKDIDDGLKVGNIGNTVLDTALLSEMMRKIIDGTYQNIHSILIVQDGKLVFEEYFYQYKRDSLHQLRSATKSFISALVGIAIDKKFISSKDESVLNYFPEYNLDNTEVKRKITVEHLLTNQSGLDCDISNDRSEGNETKMSYSDDWAKFTLDLPMIDTPGGKGMYCSGNPILLGRIIEKTTQQPLANFAEQSLFSPMGITRYKWHFKPDKSSAETFCQLYLRPRDMAKFGLMYLNNGKWNGKQIVPAEWVQQSLTKHSVVQNVDYGYLWWIKYLDAGGVRYYGKAAQGNGGQRIFIWNKQNMVTVITGGSYNVQSPSDELIRKYILPAFNKTQ